MNGTSGVIHLDRLLEEIQKILTCSAPELLETFDVYKGEAEFGQRRLDGDLKRLPPRSAIIEIGAGSLLLSCALQREGFEVTALEPIGAGFSHFVRLQEVVLRHAAENGFAPTLLTCAGEDLSIIGQFDYAFSINVMEHVEDVSSVLMNVYRSLRPGGSYRFICPNYAFPYDPHFNIITLFSRSLTERFLWNRIAGSKSVADPVGAWASLNWITVWQVKHICQAVLFSEPRFSSDIFRVFLDRALTDSGFQLRRGPHMIRFVRLLDQIQLLRWADFIPVSVQPLMDCTIVRRR